MTSTPPAERLAFELESRVQGAQSPRAGEALAAAAVHVRENLGDDEAYAVLAALDRSANVLFRYYDLEGKSGSEVIDMILRG